MTDGLVALVINLVWGKNRKTISRSSGSWFIAALCASSVGEEIRA